MGVGPVTKISVASVCVLAAAAWRYKSGGLVRRRGKGVRHTFVCSFGGFTTLGYTARGGGPGGGGVIDSGIYSNPMSYSIWANGGRRG